MSTSHVRGLDNRDKMKISIIYSVFNSSFQLKQCILTECKIAFILFLDVRFLTPQIIWYFPFLHVNFASKQNSLSLSLSNLHLYL